MPKINTANIRKPTLEELEKAVETMYEEAVEHIHELRKYDIISKFFAGCIEIGTSNLKAIIRLGYAYLNESGMIMRNLMETCVRFFLVAYLQSNDREKAEKIAYNFFCFQSYRFLNEREQNEKIYRNDIFFKDLTNPYAANENLDEALGICRDYKPDNKTKWLYDKSVFDSTNEIKWKPITEIVSGFVKSEIGREVAYYQNLTTLSAYSHFDPVQLQKYMPEYTQRIFDRNLNVSIGCVFDMIYYSYKLRNWTIPENLSELPFKYFLWPKNIMPKGE
jgi:hypothetical protein